MAALPPDSTERWWVVYTVNGFTHRACFRSTNGASNVDVSNAIHGVFNRLAGSLNAIGILGLERALQGSNVRNTFTWTQSAGYGLGTNEATSLRAQSISFVGRDIQGRRGRFFIYGYKLNQEGDYRVDTTEDTGVASVITYLNGATGFFLTVGGLSAVWKQYGNIDINDHWIKQARKTAA